MTNTVPPPTRAHRGIDVPETPVPEPMSVRTRRPTKFIVGAVALLAAAAALGVFAVNSVTTTTQVLGLVRTVPAGTQIDRADLAIVQVGTTAQLDTVPASRIDTVVGRRAAVDLPAGATLSAAALTDDPIPAKDRAIVGVLLTPQTAPNTGLEPGSLVRLVPLPQADPIPDAEPQGDGDRLGLPTQPVTGVIVAITPAEDGTGLHTDVDVAAATAPGLQALAAMNRLAVIVDSRQQ